MNQNQKKVRRKIINLSIERDMQKRLIIKISLIVFSCIFLAAVGFYLYSDQELGNAFRQAHFKVKNVKEMLFPVVLLILGLVILIAFLMTLFFPLHIAGPKYRIRLNIKRIAGGDLTIKTKLRRRDELHGLADDLNKMVSELNAKVSDLHNKSATICSLAQNAMILVKNEGKTDEIRKNMEELLKESQSLEEGLKWFKTK